MRKFRLMMAFVAALILWGVSPLLNSADDDSNDEMRSWQLNEEKYLLMQKNKQLATINDALETKIFGLKRTINGLNEELDESYRQLTIARQNLGEVQDQLRA